VSRPAARREVAGIDRETELIGLAVTLLDVLALHPLLALIAGPDAGGTARAPLWPLVALAVLARGVIWLLEQRRADRTVYTAVTALAGLGSLAALVWVEFYAAPGAGWAALVRDLQQLGLSGLRLIVLIVLGGFIWWRSLRGDAPALGAIYTRFERIVVAYVAYALITWVSAATFMQPVFTRDLFLVFLVALWAFALARSRMEGGRSRQQLGTRWFVFSLSLIGAILAAGMLVAGLFAPGVAAALFGPLSTLVQWIGVVVVGALAVLTFVISSLLEFFFGFLRSLPRGPATPTPTPAPPAGSIIDRLREQAPGGPLADTTLFTVIGVIVLVILALWAARAVLGSAQRRRHSLGAGERESLFQWGAVLDSLHRPRRGSEPEADSLRDLAGNPAYRYTVRVRRAYRRALARAAAHDVTRAPAQTADEVLPALQGAFPTARDPLRNLTALYDATRYTATPATAADAEAAEAAARALEAREH
jgi:uncharacterized protein DUF4129